MRCIAPSPGYSIQVFEAEEQVVVDARGHATTIVLKKPVIANFERQGLLDNEIEAALERFNFSGLPEGVSPLARIGCFDTEAYVARFKPHERDELLVQIDARLRELSDQFPNEFIIVDPPEAPKPWPSYDETDVEDILKFQEALKMSPETIRLYEEEHLNRAEIVDEMLSLENPEYARERAEGDGEKRISVQA